MKCFCGGCVYHYTCAGPTTVRGCECVRQCLRKRLRFNLGELFSVFRFLLHLFQQGPISVPWTRHPAAVRSVLWSCVSAGRWPVPRPGVAEADVEGFNHLKASEGQPQDERWPLGGKKKKKRRGWGLILPSLPSSSSHPLPLSLSATACLPISTRIALCKQSQSWCVCPESQCCQPCHSHFLNAFDQKSL